MIAGIANRQVVGQRRPLELTVTVGATSPSTALVPVAPVAVIPAHTARIHPNTAFLMHLMATTQHEPQTRRFRRADSATGAGGYAAATARATASPLAPRHSELV